MTETDMNGDSPGRWSDGITRRRLIANGAQGAALLGGAALLSACGASGTSVGSSTASEGSGSPRHGGTLNVGMIGAGSSETLNPGTAVTYIDILRSYQLFDPLFFSGLDVSTLVPGLATSAEPNKDASVWTIHLRQGVKWHDGKPFTADDVLWSIKSWSKPTNYASAIAGQMIDFAKARKRDALTVEVPLTVRAAQFPSIFPFFNLNIIQNGATVKSLADHPIGTGPFSFESFTPGSESVFTRNTDYWRSGKPYVDKLVITSISDETARYNALQAGTIDLVPQLATNFVRQQQPGGPIKLNISSGTYTFDFTMRVDKGPFADVRMRQAMKLLVDRKAMITSVLSGYGDVGPDMMGRYSRYYAEDLIQPHDPEKARALIKAAGMEGATINIAASQGQSGFLESATVLAQQAKTVGLNIAVTPQSLSTYFTPTGGFLSRPLGEDSGFTLQSMSMAIWTWLGKQAPYAETHWGDLKGGNYAALMQQCIAELDTAKAEQLWRTFQEQQYHQGGYVAWGWSKWIDGATKKVNGLVPSKAGPVNNWTLADLWMT